MCAGVCLFCLCGLLRGESVCIAAARAENGENRREMESARLHAPALGLECEKCPSPGACFVCSCSCRVLLRSDPDRPPVFFLQLTPQPLVHCTVAVMDDGPYGPGATSNTTSEHDTPARMGNSFQSSDAAARQVPMQTVADAGAGTGSTTLPSPAPLPSGSSAAFGSRPKLGSVAAAA